MKWAGGYEPPTVNLEPETWAEHKRVWELRRQVREQRSQQRDRMEPQPVNETAAAQLLAATHINIKQPDPVELVEQTPDAVYWLRAQMTARPTLDDGDARPSGKPGSKPPFRVAFMSAADREVAALAHWAEQYGVQVSTPLWRDGVGAARGVFPDYLDAVWELSEKLSAAIRHSFIVDGLLDHPQYGIWLVRRQHYANWPALAAIFTHETVETEDADGEQMELM